MFEQINIYIQQGNSKLIKTDSKLINNVTKGFRKSKSYFKL